MIAVFIGCGVVALGQMGVHSWSAFREGAFWSDAIAFVRARHGPTEFSFLQIVIFAWLCNSAMHFGMADLSIFRFAREAASGWAPSIGMFLGHYVAWIAAGLLLAAQIKLLQDTSANPGALAWRSMGWTGIICVVIAGGRRQPNDLSIGACLSRDLSQEFTGHHDIACGRGRNHRGNVSESFGEATRVVGLYGTILGPMGAIIFVDHYWMRRFGLIEEWRTLKGNG